MIEDINKQIKEIIKKESRLNLEIDISKNLRDLYYFKFLKIDNNQSLLLVKERKSKDYILMLLDKDKIKKQVSIKKKFFKNYLTLFSSENYFGALDAHFGYFPKDIKSILTGVDIKKTRDLIVSKKSTVFSFSFKYAPIFYVSKKDLKRGVESFPDFWLISKLEDKDTISNFITSIAKNRGEILEKLLDNEPFEEDLFNLKIKIFKHRNRDLCDIEINNTLFKDIETPLFYSLDANALIVKEGRSRFLLKNDKKIKIGRKKIVFTRNDVILLDPKKIFVIENPSNTRLSTYKKILISKKEHLAILKDNKETKIANSRFDGSLETISLNEFDSFFIRQSRDRNRTCFLEILDIERDKLIKVKGFEEKILNVIEFKYTSRHLVYLEAKVAEDSFFSSQKSFIIFKDSLKEYTYPNLKEFKRLKLKLINKKKRRI